VLDSDENFQAGERIANTLDESIARDLMRQKSNTNSISSRYPIDSVRIVRLDTYRIGPYLWVGESIPMGIQ